MHFMPLPKAVEDILARINSVQAEAYVVGGAVRNHLVGRQIDDYDITTSLTPEEVMELFSDMRVITTGLRHGTVTLLYDGVGYEITTYRVEGEYLDNRHPSTVSFTRNLADDLSRRDFTVNAMCYHPTCGLVDMFGGVQDAKNGIIRAVGNPKERFTDDALRIIRALRFASVLGFDIEENTARDIRELYPLLKNIANERIATELRKLMAGKGAYDIINEFSEVFRFLLPELASVSLPTRERFIATEDGLVRFLSLFALGSDSPVDAFTEATERLKLDRATINLGRAALSVPPASYDTAPRIAEAIYRYGADALRVHFSLSAMLGGEGDLSLLDTVEKEGIYSLRQLDIRGGDLIATGLRGAEISRALEAMLLGVIYGETDNKKESLLSYIEKKKG